MHTVRFRWIALLAAILGVSSAAAPTEYGQHALNRANEGAPNSELVKLFRAAVFLDETTSPQSWQNYGVALLHQSGATKGDESRRHGLWSLVVLELTKRMDPLGLVGSGMADANIGLLREKCPGVGPIIDFEKRPAFWRGNQLVSAPTYGEIGLEMAQSNREAESIPFYWVDLIDQDKEAAATWLNLAVTMNKARGRAQNNA